MKKNVGTVDMIFRILLSCVLCYIGFFDNPIISEEGPKNIIKFITFVPLLTGILRFCPLYTLIGMNTCGCKKEEK